jgi:DNA polymerase (family 10)
MKTSGDLHLHSKWTDGKSTILEMVRACKERGYQYCAITDHSKAVRVAGGLSAEGFKRQREEIEQAREKVPGITVFTGCEVDILPDGSLDLPDDLLAARCGRGRRSFEMDMSQSDMTKRVLKALANPSGSYLSPSHRTADQ